MMSPSLYGQRMNNNLPRIEKNISSHKSQVFSVDQYFWTQKAQKNRPDLTYGSQYWSVNDCVLGNPQIDGNASHNVGKKKQSNGLLFHPISDGKGLEKDNKTPFFMVGDSVKNVDNTSAASSGEKHRHIPPNLTFVCTESSNFYGVQSEYEVQSSRMF